MKHSWQEKLGSDGLRFVEFSAKLHRIKQPDHLNAETIGRWINEEKEILSSYPELDTLAKKRKVKLDPRFVSLMVRMDPECKLNEEQMKLLFEHQEWPDFRAEQWEVHQRIALMLEDNEAYRFHMYSAFALAFVFFKRMASSTWKRQFGTKDVGLFRKITSLVQHVKWIGDMAMGKIKPEPGRVNVELASLVEAILRFPKKPLTQLELYEAVKAAGGEVPEDPEAFRLWLHRARKSGLITNYPASKVVSG